MLKDHTHKHWADCPTCRYHPTFKEIQATPSGLLCLHPAGEQYTAEFDTEHLIAPCHGWILQQ